jgi:hypothetical protein
MPAHLLVIELLHHRLEIKGRPAGELMQLLSHCHQLSASLWVPAHASQGNALRSYFAQPLSTIGHPCVSAHSNA